MGPSCPHYYCERMNSVRSFAANTLASDAVGNILTRRKLIEERPRGLQPTVTLQRTDGSESQMRTAFRSKMTNRPFTRGQCIRSHRRATINYPLSSLLGMVEPCGFLNKGADAPSLCSLQPKAATNQEVAGSNPAGRTKSNQALTENAGLVSDEGVPSSVPPCPESVAGSSAATASRCAALPMWP